MDCKMIDYKYYQVIKPDFADIRVLHVFSGTIRHVSEEPDLIIGVHIKEGLFKAAKYGYSWSDWR